MQQDGGRVVAPLASRRTDYDVAAAAATVRAGGYPGAERYARILRLGWIEIRLTTLSPTTLTRCLGSPWYWDAWGELEHTVRTGESAFTHKHGVDVFGYLAAHPEAQRVFTAAMASRPNMRGEVIAAAYDFSSAHTVVDVGGGHGELLAAVLAANPEARGVLFDRPNVVADAGAEFETTGVAERCEIVGGDFFASVPAGDAFVLRTVVHDWPDAEAVRIVRSCRDACPDDGRILLVEMVVDPANPRSPGTMLDLEMLVITEGGRERTEAEFAELLAAGGFELTRVLPTQGPMSIIEGRPTR